MFFLLKIDAVTSDGDAKLLQTDADISDKEYVPYWHEPFNQS